MKAEKKVEILKEISVLLFKKVREENFNKWRAKDGFAMCPVCGTDHFAANAITYADHLLGCYIECRVCGSRDLEGNNTIPIKQKNTEEKKWEPWMSDDKKFYQCPHCRSYDIHEKSLNVAVGSYVSTKLSCANCGCTSDAAQIPWMF